MISPLDDRYYEEVKELEIFSEFSYFKKRAEVEVEWYNKMAEIFGFKKQSIKIDEKDFEIFKRIEKKTKHDVKAIEYLLRKKLKEKWAIHLFLTSDDVNNIAFALLLKEWKEKVLKHYKALILLVLKKAKLYKSSLMPGFTHSKKSLPTTLGKLFAYHGFRLAESYKEIEETKLYAKLSGAVGDYNAFTVANVVLKKKIDWIKIAKAFVENLSLVFDIPSTQIERGESYSKLFQKVKLFNLILLDLINDLWLLSFREYLSITQKRIGSSTMPHKANPIELENAEGNLLLSNALLNELIDRLPISRLHRDLRDSTMKRNVGVALAHSLLGIKKVIKFLEIARFDEKKMREEINEKMVSEAIQTYLRLHRIEGYEKVKALLDRKKFSREEVLKLEKRLKLKEYFPSPKEYAGLSKELTELLIKEARKLLKARKGLKKRKAKN